MRASPLLYPPPQFQFAGCVVWKPEDEETLSKRFAESSKNALKRSELSRLSRRPTATPGTKKDDMIYNLKYKIGDIVKNRKGTILKIDNMQFYACDCYKKNYPIAHYGGAILESRGDKQGSRIGHICETELSRYKIKSYSNI